MSWQRRSTLVAGCGLALALALALAARAPCAAQRYPSEPMPERGQASAAQAIDERDIARALGELSHEPSVEELVRAAELLISEERVDALASRARAAGWVPRLGVRVRRGQAVDLSGTESGDPLRLSTDDDLMLEASLTFDLDRLVFRREEISLAREARAQVRQGRELVREVVTLYYERRRLQLEQRLLGRRLERSVRIAELEALLNIFTDGEFRRMIAREWKTGVNTRDTPQRSSPRSRSTETR